MMPQQKRAFEFIKGYIARHGQSPTFQEIAAALGLKSKNNIDRLLNNLERRGLITRTRYMRRSIVLRPIMSIELPHGLYTQVHAMAAKSGHTPEEIVIAAIDDGIEAYRSRKVIKNVTQEIAGEAA